MDSYDDLQQILGYLGAEPEDDDDSLVEVAPDMRALADSAGKAEGSEETPLKPVG